MIIKPYSHHFQKCICALVFIVLTNFELRVSHQIELLKVWLFINQLHKYFNNRSFVLQMMLLWLPSKDRKTLCFYACQVSKSVFVSRLTISLLPL